MSHKCIKISSCACFLIFSGVLLMLSMPGAHRSPFRYEEEIKIVTLTFSNPEVQCNFRDNDVSDYTLKLKAPSLEAFIRASTAKEGRKELHLSGLAVFSKLVNVCQPLHDVSKANIKVNKIALISLANETVCPLQGLVVHAQNAGYSGAIFFHDLDPDRFENGTQLQHKLLIPVLYVKHDPYDCYFTNYSFGRRTYTSMTDSHLSAADRTNIDIKVTIMQTDLTMMEQYLRRLYYWFLLGPVITIEWLRRRKKLCRMSGGQQAEGGQVTEDLAVESALNTAAEHQDTQRNNSKETEHGQTVCKTQPLLIILDDTNVTKNGHTRPIVIRRVLNYLGKILGKLAVGCGYVIFVVVALPVGISAGGWSFFRFDENEIQQKSFWHDLIPSHHSFYPVMFWISLFLYSFLPMWWPPLQIFCFFLYSRLSCKTTWTVPTNFSKLIRSHWFASNMYLLILGVVLPYSASSHFVPLNGVYFACYNTVCTICNLLFILILNKHKFVTRYVFYISVCMICAYIESNIVAACYFMLNSKGSALRTAAIGLTLTLSFSSSMHIVRKLNKPKESLFEGLGEK